MSESRSTAELVEALNPKEWGQRLEYRMVKTELLHEAAAALQTESERAEQLEAERDALQAQMDRWLEADNTATREAITAWRAEREARRAAEDALKEIKKFAIDQCHPDNYNVSQIDPHPHYEEQCDHCELMEAFHNLARAALSPVTTGGDE